MAESFTSSIPDLLSELDGFRVEIDADRERADIVLDRPPLNIVTMNEREQLREVFAELARDDRVRVIVLRAEGEHFSSGGEIRGFLLKRHASLKSSSDSSDLLTFLIRISLSKSMILLFQCVCIVVSKSHFFSSGMDSLLIQVSPQALQTPRSKISCT